MECALIVWRTPRRYTQPVTTYIVRDGTADPCLRRTIGGRSGLPSISCAVTQDVIISRRTIGGKAITENMFPLIILIYAVRSLARLSVRPSMPSTDRLSDRQYVLWDKIRRAGYLAFPIQYHNTDHPALINLDGDICEGILRISWILFYRRPTPVQNITMQ